MTVSENSICICLLLWCFHLPTVIWNVGHNWQSQGMHVGYRLTGTVKNTENAFVPDYFGSHSLRRTGAFQASLLPFLLPLCLLLLLNQFLHHRHHPRESVDRNGSHFSALEFIDHNKNWCEALFKSQHID